jgi:hypothetical protein
MIKEVIARLRILNDWRTGKTDQTMEEAGIVPAQVTADIYFVCDQLERDQKTIKELKSRIEECEKKLKKYRIMP